MNPLDLVMHIKHMFLSLLLTAIAVHADDVQWSNSAPLVGEWTAARNWVPSTPESDSVVEINHPNPNAYARLRNVPGGREIARLEVGTGSSRDGELRITANSLRVQTSGAVQRSGEILIGNSGGAGRIFVKNASLSSAADIVVGGSAGSWGRLKLEAAEVVCGGELSIANRPTATGKVAICDAILRTNRLRVGDGAGTLQFVARPTMGQLVVQEAPHLAGELIVHLAGLADGSNEIVLIRNDSDAAPIGGFDYVLITNPSDRYYELTYSGGDGNDISLVRSASPVDKYDTWAAIHFPNPTDGPKRLPSSDPDQDGFSNVIEYTLGRSPDHNERNDIRRTTRLVKGVLHTSLTYERRVDRTDAVLVPQCKPAGGIWQSGLFEQEESVVGSRVDRVVATCQTPTSCETRLQAQLASTTATPNVLFVIVDDLNDWLGCLKGHPQARTPNIDRLAARGALFRQAHAPATGCNPSRVAILTGLRPADSGVYRNSQKFREHRLVGDAITIPHYFRTNGYESIGSGKIFHNEDLRSWDTYFPLRSEYKTWELRPAVTPVSGISTRGRNFDWGRLGRAEEETRDYRVTSYVMDRVREFESQPPRFLACGLFRPHLPFYVPDKYFDLFEDVRLPTIDPSDADDLPSSALEIIETRDEDVVQSMNQHLHAVHSYLAAIAYMDAQVGRLMHALDSSPEARNTIVVLMSDHGFCLGEKGHWRKDALWQRVTHVPLIVIAPGVTRPGSVIDKTVSLLDVYPTLIELCDLPERGGLSGSSLVPLLKSADAAHERPALTTRFRKQHSLHRGRYHYIRYSNGEEELYDLWNDPNEWQNLVADPRMTGVLESLADWLPRYNARTSP